MNGLPEGLLRVASPRLAAYLTGVDPAFLMIPPEGVRLPPTEWPPPVFAPEDAYKSEVFFLFNIQRSL